MADEKISQLAKIPSIDPTNDKGVVVEASTGITKYFTFDQLGIVQRTGTAIQFDLNANYGTPSTPETGNITVSLTNAKLGICQLIIHNNGTEPTYPSQFKKGSLSGTYVSGQINYILCEYFDATHIVYSISQSA